MFNFFNEIKLKCKDISDKVLPFQSVMLGNYLLYVEGFSTLLTVTDTQIVFKVKSGVMTVSGSGLFLKEISTSTLTIQGKISSVEYV